MTISNKNTTRTSGKRLDTSPPATKPITAEIAGVLRSKTDAQKLLAGYWKRIEKKYGP